MTETDNIPVLIVGGGIGGLATALAIARTGRQVHLVEQAPEFGEIGAGLQVGPNATRSLDQLGLLDEIMESAVTPRRAVIFDAVSGDRLTAIDFGEKFLKHYGYPYIVTHRRDMLDTLLAACRREENIQLSNNRTVTGVRNEDDHVRVDFADGDSWRADVVVGADGIKSQVRHILDDVPPIASGHVAFRGTLPTAQVADFISREDIALWIGPGAHLVQYPIRSGDLYNQVAVIESKRFTEGRDDWGTEEEMLESFQGMCESVRRSVALIKPDHGTPVYDRDPTPTWSVDRTVLIGDAAHAMLQYLGQGACQALEDALSLAENLKRSGTDHRQAFEGYENDRVERAIRCQQSARPWGALWHTSDPTVVALRNRVFRMRAEDDYTELDWLYSAVEQA